MNLCHISMGHKSDPVPFCFLVLSSCLSSTPSIIPWQMEWIICPRLPNHQSVQQTQCPLVKRTYSLKYRVEHIFFLHHFRGPPPLHPSDLPRVLINDVSLTLGFYKNGLLKPPKTPFMLQPWLLHLLCYVVVGSPCENKNQVHSLLWHLIT